MTVFCFTQLWLILGQSLQLVGSVSFHPVMAYSGPVFAAGKLPYLPYLAQLCQKICYITIVHHETWWLWGGFPHRHSLNDSQFSCHPKVVPALWCWRCGHNLGHNLGYLWKSNGYHVISFSPLNIYENTWSSSLALCAIFGWLSLHPPREKKLPKSPNEVVQVLRQHDPGLTRNFSPV